MNEYTRYCAQINSLSDQVNEQKKDIENLKKDKIDKEAQINNLNTQVDNLKKYYENLNKDIENLKKDKLDKDIKTSELNKDKKAQEDKISNLQKKVDYMEVILNSLISRKVIKIKKKKENEIPHIQVINNINSVSVKQSQDLYL